MSRRAQAVPTPPRRRSVSTGRAAPLSCPELERTLGFQLRRALVFSEQVFNEQMAAGGVTTQLYAILLVIESNPGCLISELCRAINVTPNNIVQPLDQLLARGLVHRDFSADDRRAKRLNLTERGAAHLAELKAMHQSVTDLFVARLGEAGLAALVDGLKTAVDGTRAGDG